MRIAATVSICAIMLSTIGTLSSSLSTSAAVRVGSLHSSFQLEGGQRSQSEVVRRIGGRQLDSSGTSFELEEGVILQLTHLNGILAVAEVNLTTAYKESRTSEEPSGTRDSQDQQCCMSRSAYERFLRLVGEIKPFGSFERHGNIGVIGPAGWVHRTDEYSRGIAVRFEKNCSSPDMVSCGIASFRVCYWLRLNGTVQSRRAEIVDLGKLGSDERYFVTLPTKEVEVSKDDYDRLHEGQRVELESTPCKRLTRIIATKR